MGQTSYANYGARGLLSGRFAVSVAIQWANGRIRSRTIAGLNTKTVVGPHRLASNWFSVTSILRNDDSITLLQQDLAGGRAAMAPRPSGHRDLQHLGSVSTCPAVMVSGIKTSACSKLYECWWWAVLKQPKAS